MGIDISLPRSNAIDLESVVSLGFFSSQTAGFASVC